MVSAHPLEITKTPADLKTLC